MASISFVTPNSNGEPECDPVDLLETGPSRHTEKFHRCLGHVKASNAHYGKGYNPYAVCTTSIGYAGSYTKDFRGGARTPGGRAKKVARGDVKVQHEPRPQGVHWKPTTVQTMQRDLATKWKGRRKQAA